MLKLHIFFAILQPRKLKKQSHCLLLCVNVGSLIHRIIWIVHVSVNKVFLQLQYLNRKHDELQHLKKLVFSSCSSCVSCVNVSFQCIRHCFVAVLYSIILIIYLQYIIFYIIMFHYILSLIVYFYNVFYIIIMYFIMLFILFNFIQIFVSSFK